MSLWRIAATAFLSGTLGLLSTSCGSSRPMSSPPLHPHQLLTPASLIPRGSWETKAPTPPATVSGVPQTTTSTSSTTSPTPANCGPVSGYQPIAGGRVMLVRSPGTAVRRPALIMLHGYTATSEGEEAVSGWTSFFAGTDVLVAYPEGSPTSVSGYGWATGASKLATTGTDDVSVVLEAVSVLINQDCADPAKIVIAGESNGSALALEVACDSRSAGRAVLFALAIPAVDDNVLAKCTSAQPFPLLVMAGALDQTVPIGGAPIGTVGFTAPKQWFNQLATGLEMCSGSANTEAPDTIHLSYSACNGRSDFFQIADGHHTWPGGPVGAGGLNPGTFPGKSVVWCRSGIAVQPPPAACASVLTTYGLNST